MDVNEKKREERIRELMRVAGMSRESAEFAEAIESGEITGDVIVEDGKAGITN
jgi:hypothetical protein